MKINGKQISLKQVFCLVIYYGCLQYFPSSTNHLFGFASRKLRYLCCRQIFKYCGKNVNVERRAFFGSGIELSIGDNSGLGLNGVFPHDIVIGRDVMIAPNCHIFSANHNYDRTDIPIIEQGFGESKKTIIEDDVWIGQQVMFTPGRILSKGSIVAAGCVLSKDFPPYSIIGGNPSRLIKNRVDLRK